MAWFSFCPKRQRKLLVALSLFATSACTLLYGPDGDLTGGITAVVDESAASADSGTLSDSAATAADVSLDAPETQSDSAPGRFCAPAAEAGPYRNCEDYEKPRTTLWTPKQVNGTVTVAVAAGRAGSSALVSTVEVTGQNDYGKALEIRTVVGVPSSSYHLEFSVRLITADVVRGASLSGLGFEGAAGAYGEVSLYVIGNSAAIDDCWKASAADSWSCTAHPFGQLPIGEWRRVSLDIRSDVSPMKLTAALDGTKLLDDVPLRATSLGTSGWTYPYAGINSTDRGATSWIVATDDVLFDMK